MTQATVDACSLCRTATTTEVIVSVNGFLIDACADCARSACDPLLTQAKAEAPKQQSGSSVTTS